MKPLQKELPRNDNDLFVFYDFETTQDTKFSYSATIHIPRLVYLQQFCEMQADINIVRDVGRESIPFLKTLSVTFLLIYVNPGVTESCG